MRVFLVGEGPHDIGDLAGGPAFRGKRPGFLQPIIEKVVGSRAEFDGAKVALLGKKRVSRRGEALDAQASLAAALAINAESELLVFVRDLDGGSGRDKRKAKSDIRRMSADIRRAAEPWSGESPTCVPGIPCRTIEAWALGDLAAVDAACRPSVPAELPAGKGPEDLWGKRHDPDSDHPKMVLRRIVGGDVTREDFASIAERSDVENVRQACPLSFEPFVAELEAAT